MLSLGSVRHKTVAKVVSVASGLIMGIYLLNPGFTSKFGAIDDHEPLDWIRNHRLGGMVEMGSVLIDETEVGEFGSSARYRPIYYVARVLQAATLGTESFRWYALVFLIFSATLALFSYTTWLWFTLACAQCSKRFNLYWAAIIPILAVVSFGALPANVGIYPRLGPSEQYAVLGISIACLAGTYLMTQSRRSWWALALIGISLSSGSKENFVIIGGFFTVIGLYRYSKSRANSELLFAGIALIPGLIVVLAIGARIFSGESDIYGGDFGDSRVQSAVNYLVLTRNYWVPATLLLLAAIGASCATRRFRLGGALCLCFFSFWMLSAIWLIFDMWFYGGAYIHPRYGIVAQLLKMLMLVGALLLSLRLVLEATSKTKKTIALVLLTASVVLAGLQFLSYPTSIEKIRQSSLDNRAATVEWQSGLERIRTEVTDRGKVDVLIVINGISEYEPFFALNSEINLLVKNHDRIFLLDLKNNSDNQLSKTLQRISTAGDEVLGISPLSAIEDTRVLCVGINLEPDVTSICSGRPQLLIAARGM